MFSFYLLFSFRIVLVEFVLHIDKKKCKYIFSCTEEPSFRNALLYQNDLRMQCKPGMVWKYHFNDFAKFISLRIAALLAGTVCFLSSYLCFQSNQ